MKTIKSLILTGMIMLLMAGCIGIRGDGNTINIIATYPEAKVKEAQRRLIERIEDLITQLENSGSVKDTTELKKVLIEAREELVRANGSNHNNTKPEKEVQYGR